MTLISDRKKSATRTRKGTFAPGNPGGPGRPAGRGPVAEMREKLGADLDNLIGVLRAQALAGDMQAVRIVLDRVLPSLRPVELPAVLALPAGGSLADQAHAVMKAAAAGNIAPSQAAQIVAALGGIAKIIESTELLERIQALEAKHGIAKAA